MRDPIVEEVRKHRMEHTRKYQGNLSAICKDLRSIQSAFGHKIVRLAPRKLEPTRASSRGGKPRGSIVGRQNKTRKVSRNG